MTTPRQNSLCRFSDKHMPEECQGHYPFEEAGGYIFLGEIPNIPGHCVVIDNTDGYVFTGYPISLFTELGEGEQL
jgi:hypothetical protein